MAKDMFMRATGLTSELADRWFHPLTVCMKSCEIAPLLGKLIF